MRKGANLQTCKPSTDHYDQNVDILYQDNEFKGFGLINSQIDQAVISKLKDQYLFVVNPINI